MKFMAFTDEGQDIILSHCSRGVLACLCRTSKYLQGLAMPFLYRCIEPTDLRGCLYLFQQLLKRKPDDLLLLSVHRTQSIRISRLPSWHGDRVALARVITACFQRGLFPSLKEFYWLFPSITYHYRDHTKVLDIPLLQAILDAYPAL